MLLLDTNVASELRGRRHSDHILNWLDRWNIHDVFLSVITVAEIRYGIALVVDEQRRLLLRETYRRLEDDFANRILDFDRHTAAIYGDISARRQKAGRRMETKDAMIAAICLHHGATLATRNVKDFEGLDLKLVNPFEGAQ